MLNKLTKISATCVLLLGSLIGCSNNAEKPVKEEKAVVEVKEPEVTREDIVIEEETEEVVVEKEYVPQELANTIIEAMGNSEFGGQGNEYEVDDQGYLVKLTFYVGTYEMYDELYDDITVDVTVAKQGITYLEISDSDYDNTNTEQIVSIFETIMKAYGIEESEVQLAVENMYNSSFVEGADITIGNLEGYTATFMEGGLSGIYLTKAIEW